MNTKNEKDRTKLITRLEAKRLSDERMFRLVEEFKANQNINRFGKLIAKHKKIALFRAVNVIVTGA